MKTLFMVLASLTLSSFAMAGLKNQQVAAGAEVMVRQVLDLQLLPNNPELYPKLTMALEGSNGGEPVEFKSVSCDVGLGSRYCLITFKQRVNNGSDENFYFFGIRVRIYQGRVIFAEDVPQAG